MAHVEGCPTFVATNFCLKKLIILNLFGSDISELWEGWCHLKVRRSFCFCPLFLVLHSWRKFVNHFISQMAQHLKVLDLSHCHCLKVTPKPSAFQNLEIFRLKDYKNLSQIDPSIGAAKSIVLLDLQECDELQELPQEMNKLGELKELCIGKTAIVEIPPCIGLLKKLEVLSAACCKSLVGLPDSISHLVNLKFLHIPRSEKLSNLPSTISKFSNLEELVVTSCKNLGGEFI